MRSIPAAFATISVSKVALFTKGKTMRAWLFQDSKQKQKLGEKDCPWSVGWYETNGRKRSKKIGSKSVAEKYRRKKEGELANNLVDPLSNRAKWSDLKQQFIDHVQARKAQGTAAEYKRSLDVFERLIKPVWVRDLTTATMDRFVQRRKADSTDISPATINKDLRALKALCRKAHRWGELPQLPVFEFLREAQRDPDFITEAQFGDLYKACDKMTRPSLPNCTPEEWWQALLAFAYTTGWRIGQILALRRDDLDFTACTASVRAEDTKGKRDATIEVHPWVMDHLKLVVGFDPLVFTWPHHRRTLSLDFDTLKTEAGIDMPGLFHRLRYGFATNNASKLDRDVLQRVMQHASSATTQRYINMVARMEHSKVADRIHVPAVLKPKIAT